MAGNCREAATGKKKNLILAEAMTLYHMPLYAKLRQMFSPAKSAG